MARTKGVSLAFRAALFICVIQRAAGATFEIQNKCAFTVWAAASAGGAKRLGKGQSWTIQVPAGSEGKFWGRTGCSFDGSGRGNCKIGDCGGLNCQRWEKPPVTLVKYALNQTFNFENLDFYGISLVNGFNLPMSIIPSDSLCNAIACSSNINAICPNALRVSDGCESACAALNTPQYCCTGDYLNSCNQSSYSEFFKGQCPQAYIYAKDEASGLFGCSTGSDYRVVFCDGAAASLQVEALDAIQRRIDKKDWISDPRYLIEWNGISCDNTSSAIRRSEINLSRRNLTGAVPQCIGRLTALVNVSLDNNHLIGAFPNFSNSTMLERLHLQNNNLTGSVPDWLSQLKNLKELFINNNNFSGIIPRQLLDKPSLNLTYSGNCYLCMHKGECQRVSRKDKMSVVLGIKISGALILVLVLVVGIAVYRKKFKIKQEDYSMIMVPNPTMSRSFTLEEIVQATQNFSRKIGQGGFGSVFFGKLPEEKDIAVKVLSFFTREGVHQFQNEVDLLSKFHHKNLVSLLGYCNESRKLMLIYEHMSQGSLRDHLYGSCAEVSQLNWKTRLQVALDAAQGLEYLHVGCNPKIIHRDVKTANILLDGHMNGKLADFGISRITINGATHVTTAVKGTIGYVDPEYFHTQMLTEKSDVYSFGVVLLEIICGRPPINASLPKEELNLIDWVRPYVEMDENLGDIAVIIDKRLGGNYNMKSIAGVVKLAFRCIKAKPYSRPSVSEVVAQIKKAVIQENENNVTVPNLEGTGTEHGVLQTYLVRSRVESRPREMEWADNSSNLSQVGR